MADRSAVDMNAVQEQTCEELMRLLRCQRHDFMNHLQVIHGMIQLGKFNEVKAYIEDLAQNPGLITNAMQAHAQQQNCRLQNEA